MSAAGKQQSIYIIDRTKAAVRPGDTLSGRVNEMTDRYLEIVEMETRHVRARFKAAEWKQLLGVWGRLMPSKLQAVAVRVRMEREFPQDDPLGDKLDDMTVGDYFVMIEALEADLIQSKTPATHS